MKCALPDCATALAAKEKEIDWLEKRNRQLFDELRGIHLGHSLRDVTTIFGVPLSHYLWFLSEIEMQTANSTKWLRRHDWLERLAVVLRPFRCGWERLCPPPLTYQEWEQTIQVWREEPPK